MTALLKFHVSKKNRFIPNLGSSLSLFYLQGKVEKKYSDLGTHNLQLNLPRRFQIEWAMKTNEPNLCRFFYVSAPKLQYALSV